MTRALALLALLAIPALCFAEEEKKKPRKPPPPPPPGIWWEAEFEKGMARAAREGRPILFCINALDTERANLNLRAKEYRSPEWGQATRGYVAFPCHPASDDSPDGKSTRYVGVSSKVANDALAFVLKRFGPNQISPQHIILEPDGDLAYRKEYYTYVVGPRLLEAYISKVSPPVAYTRASIDREARIKALAKFETAELESQIRVWLKSGDGYAAAVVLNALDDEYDKARRMIMIRAMSVAPKIQMNVAAYGADERISWPDDESAETEAWVGALLEADRSLGVWAAARAMARTEDGALRGRIKRLWGADKLGALSPEERRRAEEALILSGEMRTAPAMPSGTEEAARRRMLRAAKKMGLVERRWPPLDEAFSDGRPAVVRGALMEADAEDVAANSTLVEEALTLDARARVRIAAACALLRAGQARDAGTVANELRYAVFDPVEGPDARAHAAESLGTDPGEVAQEWADAIVRHLTGTGGGR